MSQDFHKLTYRTTVEDIYGKDPIVVPNGYEVIGFSHPAALEPFLCPKERAVAKVCQPVHGPRLILKVVPTPVPPPAEGSWHWAVQQMLGGNKVRHKFRRDERMYCARIGHGTGGSVTYKFFVLPHGESKYLVCPEDLGDGWEVCE